MSYTKTNWVNGSAPALSAENLNKMEQGIYENSLMLTDAFYITTFSPTGYNFTSGQSRDLSRTYTEKTGYTPIVISIGCSNSSYIDIVDWYLDNGSINYSAVNRGSSSVSANFRIVLLYIKTALIGTP